MVHQYPDASFSRNLMTLFHYLKENFYKSPVVLENDGLYMAFGCTTGGDYGGLPATFDA
jgi:hypothetical protein